MTTRVLLSVMLMGAISAGSAHAQGTRIMPLGDSITESSDGHASYRYWLWHDLASLGRCVDFVGSQEGVFAGTPRFDDFDADHEGHWGWRVDEILSFIEGWAQTHQPQIVMIHLGTNDLFQGQDVPSTIDELGQVIETLRSVYADVDVLLAQIIPVADWIGTDVTPLNDAIVGLASSLDTPQSRVVVIDQFTGFDPALDTWDGVHPNESGEKKMAAKWLDGLLPWLPVIDADSGFYGSGYPGTHGVPSLGADGDPVLGAPITLEISSSSGVESDGVLLVGTTATSVPGSWGGDLLVVPSLSLAITVPGGGWMATVAIPDDGAFCGVEVFLQALQVDAGAARGLSSTAGLALTLGR